jgi:hypothetical protein
MSNRKEAKMATPEEKIQTEKRDLEFRLIEVNAQIEKLTPESLRDHILFRRNEAARNHELQVLHGTRQALIEQVRILSQQLSMFQQAGTGKRLSRGPTKQKKIYERVHQLRNEQPDKNDNERFSIVADEMDMRDEAVRERYYQQQRKEVGKKSTKKASLRSGPPDPTPKAKK